jgi:hypothetical protein
MGRVKLVCRRPWLVALVAVAVAPTFLLFLGADHGKISLEMLFNTVITGILLAPLIIGLTRMAWRRLK